MIDPELKGLKNKSRRAVIWMCVVMVVTITLAELLLSGIGRSQLNARSNKQLRTMSQIAALAIDDVLATSSTDIATAARDSSKVELRAVVAQVLREHLNAARANGVKTATFQLVSPEGVVVDNAGIEKGTFSQQPVPSDLKAVQRLAIDESGHTRERSMIVGFARLRGDGWGVLASQSAGEAGREGRLLSIFFAKVGIGISFILI